MHALVTGGGGFLGRYIVEALLARGDRVRSFARGEYPELKSLGVEMVRGDLARPRDGDRRVPGSRLRVSRGQPRRASGGRGASTMRRIVVGTQNVIDGLPRERRRPARVHQQPERGVRRARSMRRRRIGAVSDWMMASAHYPYSKALAEQAVLAANGDAACRPVRCGRI